MIDLKWDWKIGLGWDRRRRHILELLVDKRRLFRHPFALAVPDPAGLLTHLWEGLEVVKSCQLL